VDDDLVERALEQGWLKSEPKVSKDARAAAEAES